jgi:hypothetical protein
LNVAPLNIGTCGSCEDKLKRALVLAPHGPMVPKIGTLFKGSNYLPAILPVGREASIASPTPHSLSLVLMYSKRYPRRDAACCKFYSAQTTT